MKKILFAVMAIAIIVTIATSCKRDTQEKTDLTNIGCVDSTLMMNLNLNEFTKGSFEKKVEFINSNRNQLTYNVYSYTSIRNCENMTFIIGSGECSVEGKRANFTNELLVVTNGLGNPDTSFVTTGTRGSNIKLSEKTEVGQGAPWRFKISEGEKLETYLSSIEKWDSIKIKTSYIMPGLEKDQKFADFLKEKEDLILPGDEINCFERRVLDGKHGDRVNFPRRARLKKM